MSLLEAMFRPRPRRRDKAIEDTLRDRLAEIEPDPLFVRRLRGDAVNRFVAAREGSGPITEGGAKTMGRLGRACLIASFALGASAMSVMAASQVALPGDPLYALKLRIEQVRLDVLPAHLDDELAAFMLAVRIDEFGRLAEAGRWDEAMALAPVIEQAYERFVPEADARANSSGASPPQLLVLEVLVERLPDGARAALHRVIERVTDDVHEVRDGASPGGAGVNAHRTDADAPRDPSHDRLPNHVERTQSPQSAPEPDPTAEHDPTPTPERTPQPERTQRPDGQAPPEAPANEDDEGD